MSLNKKRVLVASANSAEVPIIKYLQSKSFTVITLSGRKEDIGHQFSDEQVITDYSKPDLVLNEFKKQNCDFLIPGSNDFSMFSCALVAEELNLIGYDSFKITSQIHYKDQLRSLQKELNLNYPKFIQLNENHDLKFCENIELTFPVIVKPVDMTGGKGISVCHNKVGLDFAIGQVRKISRKAEIVVEEFLEGTGHGFSCILKDQKVIFNFDDDEYYWASPFLVSGTSSPSSLSEERKNFIKNEIEIIAKKLNLKDGLLHAQSINTKNGIYITEICRRTPGDMYVDFVTSRTNFDYVGAIVNPYIGLETDLKNNYLLEEKYTARLSVHPKSNGTIRSINLDVLNEYIDKKFIWLKANDFIRDNQIEKVGILFLSFRNFKEMIKMMDKFPTLDLVNMK